MTPLNILMVSAENGALPGGKVGGIGDVVRDAPAALARLGHNVTVVTPAYGFLHRVDGVQYRGSVTFSFAGHEGDAWLHEVPGSNNDAGVRHLVVEHPAFEWYDHDRGEHVIYVHDPEGRPFETDATKFARFCMAVAQGLKTGALGDVDCIHLHDWHAAFFLVLTHFHPDYMGLAGVRTVFTVHNLAIQGTRPFDGGDSSLNAWYPGIWYDHRWLEDPRNRAVFSPMATGIRLADAVHVVSPTYAEEVLAPSDGMRFSGGEGLEGALAWAKGQGRLHGILNGCEYPPGRVPAACNFDALASFLREQTLVWAGKQTAVARSHFLAYVRLSEWLARKAKPGIVLTSVSRLTWQKCHIMRTHGSVCESGLRGVLDGLGGRGAYLLLGTGMAEYEEFLLDLMDRYPNFVFLNGFSGPCADRLYANGDLFLMPSTYEPCGIGQMLAMRDGQPCVAHAVGGLKDTVQHGVNGFTFDGWFEHEQVDRFVETTLAAIDMKLNKLDQWARMCNAAASARFEWEDSVQQYVEKLYRPGG